MTTRLTEMEQVKLLRGMLLPNISARQDNIWKMRWKDFFTLDRKGTLKIKDACRRKSKQTCWRQDDMDGGVRRDKQYNKNNQE